MTAFLVAYALFEVPGGLLGDRLGVRHVLALFVVAWSLLTAAVALVVYLPTDFRLGYLLVLRFCFGAFQAGAFPLVSRMLTDWVPFKERASAQGFVWMSSRVGGFVAPLALGELIIRLGSWQAALTAAAALGLLWAAFFWPWFRNKPDEMDRVNDAERQLIAAGRATALASHHEVPWRAMLRSRSVWALCLMYGFMGFSATFFLTLLPTYLQNHRRVSNEEMRWLTALPFACGIGACMLGGLFSDWFIRRTGNRKWGRRMNGLVGLTGAGIAVLSTLWVENIHLLGFLLCLTFFCNDVNMGPSWAACADIGERYAGTVGGAMNMFGSLFAAAMTALAGRLLARGNRPFEIAGMEVYGRDLLFVIFAISFGLAALCWLFIDVTKRLTPATSPIDAVER